MKKFIILLTIILSTNTVFSATTNNAILDKMETSVFGFNYPKDTETKRIERLEENIYGKKSTGQTSSRIAKLKKDLNADLIGQQIEAKEDTFAKDDDSIVYEKEPVEAASMDYPVINELEQALFKQEYKKENIKARLSRLENKSLGKTYDKDDLSTRVDRLKAKIRPQMFMANEMEKQENNFYNGDIGKLSKNYHLDSYGYDSFDYDNLNNTRQNNYSDYSSFDDYQSNNVFNKPSKPLNISSIEKVLYKTKYENEPMEKRLSRVESSVFGTNFSNDSESERIERLSSAINAQKSAKRYDSNRFGQNMATAFQIGTFILMILACVL